MAALSYFLGSEVTDMIVINGLTIKIHKGNAAGFSLHLTGEELPEDGTIIRFRVRKNQYYNNPAIEKLIPIQDGNVDVDIFPNDTKDLAPGEYHWNLAVMYENGTEPWTLLENAPIFVVLPEDGRCND